MNENFRVYNDSAILNRVIEFPETLVWTEMHIMFWTTLSCEYDATPSITNVTRLNVMDDFMKIKLAAKWRLASLCPVRAVIYQPINHWIYPLAI